LKKSILLLFADLDGMKWINDNLGHKEGDNALIDIAHILKETFRESDIIARIGGDEFTILAIESCSDETLLTRLQDKINSFNAKGSRRYKLSISIGVVCYRPESPCSIDELLAQADKTMYEQKREKQKL
jgi:diguanylate cyclase (GGDEF)-like protein